MANMQNMNKDTALRLAEELDDGYPLTGDAISAAAELRTQHARITELEAQLSSSGFAAADMASASAQGFLDGVDSLAASAGSEPVAWTTGLNWQPDPRSKSEMLVKLTRRAQPQYGFTTPLYTHPSPPDGMVSAYEVENLRRALQFYANKDHFAIADEMAWDTVSGEPQNYWCDEAGTAMVEDGSIAKMALAGHHVQLEDDDEAAPPTTSAGSGKVE